MDLLGIHFANPLLLGGVLLSPLLLAIGFFHSRARHSTLQVGNPLLVAEASGLFSSQLIPWFFRFLILALCFIAAARPQEGHKKVEEKKPVTDLMVTLDVSGSMVSQDLKPSRIEAAKKILSQFLDQVENVRAGLTIFARISFTQCPLTTDLSMIKRLLATVEPAPGSIKIDGTAIGDALVSSLNRLQNGTGKTSEEQGSKSSFFSKFIPENSQAGSEKENNKPESEAILLLTDGGNNAGMVDPLTAAKIAASRGIKIYAIGVGSLTQRVPMIFTYPDGRKTYGLDQNGNVIMEEPVDMGLLKEIARITGGKAYNAGDTHSLKSVLDDVAHLEKKEVSVSTHWEYNELASFFLLAAFLILVLDLGLETTVLRTLP